MSWLSAGASFLSSGLQAGLSYLGQSEANEAAYDIFREKMAFDERMFKNRYRYTMEDMRRAGLNPILAYKQGGGSPPTAGLYQPGNEYAGAASAAGAGVSSALAARRADLELDAMAAQIDVAKEQAKNVRTDTEVKGKQVQNVVEDTYMKRANTKLMDMTSKLRNEERRRVIQDAANMRLQEFILQHQKQITAAAAKGATETEKVYASIYGQWLRWIQATFGAFEGPAGASALRGVMR